MPTFKSVTTIEFEDRGKLEDFVKALPWDDEDIQTVLDGEEYVDTDDQAEADGAGETIHIFSIED